MSRNRYEWHIRNDEGGITLRKGSRSFPMHVEDWGEGVLRILAGTEVPSGSPPFLQGRGKPVIPEISHEILAFSTEASSFIMDRNGVWDWTHKGRTILQSADDCYVSPRGVRSLAPALSLKNRSATFSFHLTPDEPVFGGGETFGQINKRRLKMELRITDTCGLTTTPMSYKHIPLFWSPRGWGVFAGTGHHVTADIGCSSFISMSLEIREPRLDIFLIPGAPCDIIKHYWRLTGVPPLPPAWGLAPWWSRCMYRNAGEVKAVVSGLTGMGIREGVISLDPLWLRNRLSWKHDACDFVWNESAFGDMQAFCDWLHGEGFKLCLWENPRVWLDGEDPAGLRSFVMKDSGGNILQAEAPLSRGGRTRRMEHTGVWDFASPEAWEKRKMLIRQLLMRGADTFKTDYGEGAPGEDHHNMYAFQYLKNTWEAIEEIRGPAETMIWARPGWSGCQRFPGCWAGDSQSTFASMASTLSGCLSAAASGYSWWSHDIGGFHHYTGRPPDSELYLRWAEWGMLSPLARFHGTTPREPWHFGEEATRIVSRLMVLRRELISVMRAAFADLSAQGKPMGRPLVMDYPEDPAVRDLGTEYMMADRLLIAPVLEAGASSRNVYFPEGEWRRWKDDDERIHGPAMARVSAGMGRPIIFERIGW